jgi:hypothetical protein
MTARVYVNLPEGILGMWLKQCHKPFPNYPKFTIFMGGFYAINNGMVLTTLVEICCIKLFVNRFPLP